MIHFGITPPIAGKTFSFSITPETPNDRFHRVNASIGGEQIYDQTVDCPDPPCHETMFIPAGAGGKSLVVNYSNIAGVFQTYFEIKP